MAVEQWSDNLYDITPGPFDVHTHPRVFDTLTRDDFVTVNEGTEGKAGLRIYTEAALRSGITGIAAMPNESVRQYDATDATKTEEKPYPIASYDRVLAMQAAVAERAVIPTAIYMGLDPETAFWDEGRSRLQEPFLRREFRRVQDDCLGLKVYLAETTGGNNIAVEHGAKVADLWHAANPDKPVVFHVEGNGVDRLLHDIYNLRSGVGKELPIHIAHVSSRQELKAVIAAKIADMNVTCEVTPHHLTLDEFIREELGGRGCVKPSLKSADDIAFLWNNMRYIDIFASDCAPHRVSDKDKNPAAFGVTNHTVMLPLLLGAVADGRLTMDDIYQKFCVTPRRRFNLPLDDGSFIRISLAPKTADISAGEHDQLAEYGQSPYTLLGGRYHMLGRVLLARAGRSVYSADFSSKTDLRTSYTHQIRPKNVQYDTVREVDA
jgi:dihydroorotase-like cyclic amidohydrolase